MSSHITNSKKQMALLTMLVLFSPLAIDIYLPALPLIASTFQVENALAQDTITLVPICYGCWSAIRWSLGR